MRDQGGRQKSFTTGASPVASALAVIFLVLGTAFLVVALIMQLVPLRPGDVGTRINGVYTPGTAEAVREFRMAFLLPFGLLGLAFLCVGLVALSVGLRKRRTERALAVGGIRVVARIAGTAVTKNVRVNHRPLERLVCTYEMGGTIYEFRSAPLRQDPTPYLPDGTVNVYYDSNDMHRYYVDIDGTVAATTRIVSL